MLCVEGCNSIEWDVLRSFVESRLPKHHRTFAPRGKRSRSSAGLSPSSSGHTALPVRAVSSPPGDGLALLGWPSRMRTLDVRKCPQINKAMVQWLKRLGCDVRHDAVNPL